MTARAKRLLRMAGATDEAAVRLTRSNAKAADDLVALDLAVYIPISSDGADVALTALGIMAYQELKEVPHAN